MARTFRNIGLETRTNRFLLTEKKKHWQKIGDSLSIGYRRAGSKSSWYVRMLTAGVANQKVIAEADDYKDANGKTVLTYKDATQLAISIQNEGLILKADYTVKQAMADYVEHYKVDGNKGAGGKDLSGVLGKINNHILPTLGNIKLAELTTKQIKDWRNRIATSPAKLRSGRVNKANVKQDNDPRARKSSTNRILTTLKAALNHAYREGLATSDDAWRRVKPFNNVDQARIRFLSDSEATRFINACDNSLRQIAQAALFTGARYGELSRLTAQDFSQQSVFIEQSKSGKARYIPLSDDGVAFFKRLVAGKQGCDPIFTRSGRTWSKSLQCRPVKDACANAKINPPISFHILRHTYASHLVMAGTPLEVVSQVLGHSDVRTTQKHYAHLAPSYVADLVRANMPTLGAVSVDNVVALES